MKTYFTNWVKTTNPSTAMFALAGTDFITAAVYFVTDNQPSVVGALCGSAVWATAIACLFRNEENNTPCPP